MLGVNAGLALDCDLDLLLRACDAAERETEAVRVEQADQRHGDEALMWNPTENASALADACSP